MLKKLLLKTIKFYQKFVSPLLGQRCRFYPTCSGYCLLAVEKHGFVRGTAKTVWRVLRCGPWSAGGEDWP